MNWQQIKPNLLRSECGTFSILTDDRYSPPLYRVTKRLKTWIERGWSSYRTKSTLGRFDTLEDAQRACEGAV